MPVQEPDKAEIKRSTISFYCGSLSALIGAIALAGWHANIPFLTGQYGGYAPITYNSALICLVLGAATLLMNLSRTREAGALAAAALIFSAAHLAEYASGADWGVGEWFRRDNFNPAAPHPARMAVDTAASFFLAAAALTMIRRKTLHKGRLLAALPGAMVFAHGFSILLIYLGGMEPLLHLHDQKSMSLPSSLGLTCLGMGITALAARNDMGFLEKKPPWMPQVIAVVTIVFFCNLALTMNRGYRQDFEEHQTVAARNLLHRIFDQFRFYAEVTHYMSRRWNDLGTVSEHSWASEAEFHVSHCIPMHAIHWLDAGGKRIWSAPRQSNDESVANPDFPSQPRLREAMARSAKIGGDFYLLSEEGEMLDVLSPAFHEGQLLGFTLSEIAIGQVVKKSLKDFPPSIAKKIELLAGGRLVYGSRGADSIGANEKPHEQSGTLQDTHWKLRLWGDEDRMNSYIRYLPWAVFLSGTFLAFVSMMWLERMAGVEKMKTEFLRMAAHELRTPLTPIRGFAELLALRDNLTGEQIKKYAQLISKESAVLSDLIGDLLDLSRVESERGFELELSPCDLLDIVRNELALFSHVNKERNFNLKLEGRNEPFPLDRHKIGQVLRNLISNAVKYSPKDSPVDILLEYQKGCVICQVADRGIGMNEEQLSHLFEKFYRADKSGKIPGTGLGLVIVKTIVEMHKGKITVDSHSDQGTTARFILPTNLGPG